MKKDFEILQLELASLVRYISSLTPNQTELMLDRSGFLILQNIEEKGPAGIKELADYFKLDISTMSRQVRSLEKKDCLKRNPKPEDKRAFTLSLTAKGEDMLNTYRDIKVNRIKELFGHWEDQDLKDFSSLLQKANDAIRKSKLQK